MNPVYPVYVVLQVLNGELVISSSKQYLNFTDADREAKRLGVECYVCKVSTLSYFAGRPRAELSESEIREYWSAANKARLEAQNEVVGWPSISEKTKGGN